MSCKFEIDNSENSFGYWVFSIRVSIRYFGVREDGEVYFVE
nr:MAG TPA: hypothetical protein [Bacteriophage sp.]